MRPEETKAQEMFPQKTSLEQRFQHSEDRFRLPHFLELSDLANLHKELKKTPPQP